jgi:hypothetical protein
MSLQAIFPSPSRIELPEEFKKKAPRFHKKIVHILDNHTSDVEMIGDGAKIIRDSFATASRIKKKEINPTIIGHMNALADTFECLETFGNIKTLIDISKKKARNPQQKKMLALKSSAAIFSIAYGVISGFKLVNELILQNLSKIALYFGKIPVFGLPFTTVLGIFDILRTSIETVISTFKLRKFSKELSYTAKKIKKRWNRPIDASFAKAKKSRLKHKQVALLKEAKTLCRAIELTKKPKDYQRMHTELAVLKNHYISREEKLAKWENIHQKLKGGTISPDQLEDFRTEKLQKWKIKKINLKWRIGKEILSFVLACATILFVFTMTVIGFTGIVALPVFILASGIVSHSLGIGYFGKHLLIKYKNDTPYKKVEVPALV